VSLAGRDVVVLDGGMGQELRRRRARAATALWSAEVMRDAPDLVAAVHRDFVAAGARVITANTYAVTPQRLARDGDPALFEHLQRTALDAAAAARADSPHPVRIAGCLPPLVASYRPDLAPPAAACRASYERIVAAQADRVDLFLAETQAASHEATAATAAAVASGRPVWCAFTVDDGDGRRLRSGEPLADAARQAIDVGAAAVLVNCSVPEAVGVAVEVLADLDVPSGAYANGFTTVAPLQPGGTVDALEARTDLDPATYADHALSWVRAGAAIVGGCCEVGPAHIAELTRRLAAAGARLDGDAAS